MKILIAGSRTINSIYLLERAIAESGFGIDEIVSGGASGVDTMAMKWAKRNNVPFVEIKADWQGNTERHITKNGHTYDPLAGHDRNKEMCDYADGGIFIWDGESSGTRHSIEYMKSLGKPVRVLRRVMEDRSGT